MKKLFAATFVHLLALIPATCLAADWGGSYENFGETSNWKSSNYYGSQYESSVNKQNINDTSRHMPPKKIDTDNYTVTYPGQKYGSSPSYNNNCGGCQ